MIVGPIRYMGSKRTLAPVIADVIHNAHPSSTVVDVFAGTCAIGTALAPRHRIWANDIHAFAEVIARALLSTAGRVPLPSEAWEELSDSYEKNRLALLRSVNARCSEENDLLKVIDRRKDAWRAFAEFTQAELELEVPAELRGLRRLSTYRNLPTTEPYRLFTSYFASAYVGVRQAIEIDSLRFAIDHASPDHRDYYLFALLRALSLCATGPGHFAQFLVPRDRVNTRYIARLRRRSIVNRFKEALLELSRPACVDRRSNRVFRGDATAFLLGLKGSRTPKNLVIYADPPYSRAQYSRYYHVLETLVLYDYPEATGKGRYRGNRIQTEFSRRTTVEEAFRDFVLAASESRAALYLSYPKNGLLFTVGKDVSSILKQFYRKVRIVASVNLNHSTMGAAPGKASVQVMEDVYYAEP